jgi:hypothetical protein
LHAVISRNTFSSTLTQEVQLVVPAGDANNRAKRWSGARVAMTRRTFAAVAPGLAVALLGCDSAPHGALDAVSGVPSGLGRIYVYRENRFYDAQVWTAVSLNGGVVGSSAPGTVFYRDITPGRYVISARSDKLYPDQARTVLVEPGKSVFARITALPYYGKTALEWQGNTFVVEIMAPAVAQAQIGRLKLTQG